MASPYQINPPGRGRNNMKYAQLPVYAYQTYDPTTLQFKTHPIVPREKMLFSEHRFADGRPKNGSVPHSTASSIRSLSPAISHAPSESHEAPIREESHAEDNEHEPLSDTEAEQPTEQDPKPELPAIIELPIAEQVEEQQDVVVVMEEVTEAAPDPPVDEVQHGEVGPAQVHVESKMPLTETEVESPEDEPAAEVSPPGEPELVLLASAPSSIASKSKKKGKKDQKEKEKKGSKKKSVGNSATKEVTPPEPVPVIVEAAPPAIEDAITDEPAPVTEVDHLIVGIATSEHPPTEGTAPVETGADTETVPILVRDIDDVEDVVIGEASQDAADDVIIVTEDAEADMGDSEAATNVVVIDTKALIDSSETNPPGQPATAEIVLPGDSECDTKEVSETATIAREEENVEQGIENATTSEELPEELIKINEPPISKDEEVSEADDLESEDTIPTEEPTASADIETDLAAELVKEHEETLTKAVAEEIEERNVSEDLLEDVPEPHLPGGFDETLEAAKDAEEVIVVEEAEQIPEPEAEAGSGPAEDIAEAPHNTANSGEPVVEEASLEETLVVEKLIEEAPVAEKDSATPPAEDVATDAPGDEELLSVEDIVEAVAEQALIEDAIVEVVAAAAIDEAIGETIAAEAADTSPTEEPHATEATTDKGTEAIAGETTGAVAAEIAEASVEEVVDVGQKASPSDEAVTAVAEADVAVEEVVEQILVVETSADAIPGEADTAAEAPADAVVLIEEAIVVAGDHPDETTKETIVVPETESSAEPLTEQGPDPAPVGEHIPVEQPVSTEPIATDDALGEEPAPPEDSLNETLPVEEILATAAVVTVTAGAGNETKRRRRHKDPGPPSSDSPNTQKGHLERHIGEAKPLSSALAKSIEKAKKERDLRHSTPEYQEKKRRHQERKEREEEIEREERRRDRDRRRKEDEKHDKVKKERRHTEAEREKKRQEDDGERQARKKTKEEESERLFQERVAAEADEAVRKERRRRRHSPDGSGLGSTHGSSSGQAAKRTVFEKGESYVGGGPLLMINMNKAGGYEARRNEARREESRREEATREEVREERPRHRHHPHSDHKSSSRPEPRRHRSERSSKNEDENLPPIARFVRKFRLSS